ncbi:Putative zinc metalloprotease Rip2 [bacterium HR30]|nr:Putative zinc metalloprotease Rip2 [bacterium HR30]
MLCASEPNVFPTLVQEIIVWAVPVLLAVILHEVAHGYVAYLLGDPTAKQAGRITLNPVPHIDPFGTLALPLLLIVMQSPFLFGYARPVPVDFARLRHPRRDMVLVAAAGPVTNLLLATAFALLLPLVWIPHLPPAQQPLLAEIAFRGVLINVALAVFNLLPVPPLDGGRVLAGLVPPPLASLLARIEPFGMFIVVALVATNAASVVMRPVIRGLLGLLL